MGLVEFKLGELIELCEARNSSLEFGVEKVKGISIQKAFMQTKADMDGVGLSPYFIVEPDDFAYVTVTSRNAEKITLAHNTTNESFICSSSYVVFRVKEKSKLLSHYLFMYFNRPEFDRYARFNSWGSAREIFSFEDLCDISITLPEIEIQQKFVSIYKALQENLSCYERGLDELKLCCDIFIERLKKQMPSEAIGGYIEAVSEVNLNKEFTQVQGVEASGVFINTRANMQGVDISKYTIVRKDNIAYNPSRVNLGSIAIYTNDTPCIVSPMYVVFRVIDKNKILPQYLMLWFSRKEFQRATLYFAAGSVRDTFDLNLMKEIQIPIPKIQIQQNIVDIYNAYTKRKQIAQSLKTQIKSLCPLLIKGACK